MPQFANKNRMQPILENTRTYNKITHPSGLKCDGNPFRARKSAGTESLKRKVRTAWLNGRRKTKVNPKH